MNDLSELQYSRGLVEKRLRTRLDVAGLSEIQRDFIGRVNSPQHCRLLDFPAAEQDGSGAREEWKKLGVI